MHQSDYTVLIIDDNSDDITLLERFLSRNLIPIRSITIARKACEGLEKIRNELPDFIIIGEACPDMSRSELLKEISQIISFETVPTLCLVNDEATATLRALRANQIGVVKKSMLTPEKLHDVMRLLMEQTELRVQRKRAEMLFNLLSENSNDAIALTDANGVLVAANKRYLNVFQLDASSIGKQIEFNDYGEVFFKSDHASLSKTWFNDENGNRLELEVKRLFVEERGKRKFMLSLYKEIQTEPYQQTQSHSAQEVAALPEEARLLRELENIHKDAHQTLQVILRVKSKHSPKEKFELLLREHNWRMSILVAASEGVCVSESQLKVNTHQYVKRILDMFQKSPLMRSNIEMKYEGESVWLELSRAILIGLILNELITNALQHAFSSRGGRITVSFFKEKDESISMAVIDSGSGMPFRVETKPPDAMGLVVVGSLTKKLNGKMEVKRHTGTTVRIVFPQKNAANEQVFEAVTMQ